MAGCPFFGYPAFWRDKKSNKARRKKYGSDNKKTWGEKSDIRVGDAKGPDNENSGRRKQTAERETSTLIYCKSDQQKILTQRGSRYLRANALHPVYLNVFLQNET